MLIVNRWLKGRLVVGCVAVVLAACTAQAPNSSPESGTRANESATRVIKSDNDRRDYRYLVLPNQLRVLLISDPETDKSAASLDVHVGAAADPRYSQGLAHFLEHMLFLGTEKYPEAGEYQSFISSHGGSHNAYTAFEHTNYFFDIDPEFLEPTLDRFSQFFIAPLFNEEYVAREKKAVHSEYRAKIKSDQRRNLDVLKTQVNPQHPFAKFSVGNLETLAAGDGEPPLRDQLLDFHDEHYSANTMTLVVLGQEKLPQLERMVREKFDAVPNRDRTVEQISEPLFDPAHRALPVYLEVKPEKTRRTLSIGFPTAEVTDYYRRKPLHYIGNILGHEGEHSLLSWLKDKGWAEGLRAGTGLSYEGGATFNITIELTREGVEQVEPIVAALFQTIERIRRTPDQQWLYREQQQLAEQDFRYQETSDPIHYVMSLSTDMHYYEPADTLRGRYMMEAYDAELIDRFLGDLVPDNSVITLSAPEVETDRKSPYYQTPYSAASPPAERVQRWQNVALNEAIRLPEPNPFIAETLALKAPQFNAREQALYQAEVPALIRNEQGLKLWYKPDSQYRVPRGSIIAQLKSPLADDSPENQAMLRLLTALVSDQLNEISYPATLAGLSYSISPNSRGFALKIHGYDDKQTLLLDKILATVDRGDFAAQRFRNIKREQVRNLKNTIKDQPYRRVLKSLPKLLYRDRFSNEALLQAYQTITPQRLAAFHRQLLSGTALDILVHGNYRQAEAEAIATRLQDTLLRQPRELGSVDVAQLDEKQYTVPVHSDYTDAAVLLYLQGADLELSTRAALGVTSQVLRADFYSSLRTEKQLGYVVTSGAYPVRDVPGIFFLVQSPVAGADSLRREIQTYLEDRQQMVQGLSQAEFDRHRDALVSRLQEAPKNLWDQSREYWKDIRQHNYRFDTKERLIEALNALTLSEWQQSYRQQVAGLPRALWLYAVGQFDDDAAMPGQRIDNLATAKPQLRYYQFP